MVTVRKWCCRLLWTRCMNWTLEWNGTQTFCKPTLLTICIQFSSTWVIPSSMPQSRHPTSSSWSSSRNLKESLRSALEKLCGCMRMMWGGMAAFEHWIWSPSSIWLPWCFRWKTLSQRSRAYFQMRPPSFHPAASPLLHKARLSRLWTIQGGKRWDLRENSTNVMRFKVWKTIAMIRRPSTLGIMFRVVLLKSRPWSGPWSTLITWGAQRTSSMCESPWSLQSCCGQHCSQSLLTTFSTSVTRLSWKKFWTLSQRSLTAM